MKNLLFEELNIGDTVKITMQDSSLESGQWIETTVLSKAFTGISLSIVVDLSGISFFLVDSEDCSLLEFKGRVKIAQTSSNGCKVVGYAFDDSVNYFGEWDVAVSTIARRT